MVTILSNNINELALIQYLIENGILNNSKKYGVDKCPKINANYRLTNSHRIISNQYHTIIGEMDENNNITYVTIFE